MSLIKADHLFVRDQIREELDSKLDHIVEVVLSAEFNYEDITANPFRDFCVRESLRFSVEITWDEFQYILENVQVACAIQDLVQQGKVVKEDGVYRLVKDAKDHHCGGC